MKKFWNLLVFEVNRHKNIYRLLLFFITLATILNVARIAFTISQETHQQGGLPYSLEAFFDYSWMGMLYLILIVVLFWFSSYTWMRDWLFQGQFIRRLLTIPGNRFPIALAKLCHLILMTLGIFTLQLILMYASDAFLSLIFDHTVYQSQSVSYLLQNIILYNLLLPTNLQYFFAVIIVAINLLLAIYIIFLMMFSYRLLGWFVMMLRIVLYGIFFLLFTLSFLLFPLLLATTTMEVVIVFIVNQFFLLLINSFFIYHFLNNKVMV